MLPFLSAVPLSAFPCLTLTSGEYLIVPLKNRSVTRILQLQFFEPSENGVHDLPVVTHSSHYMKCHLKCLVMQIITSDDLVIPLNFKSMDCSLSMSTVWVFYVFNSVISKVWHVMFWYTGLLLVSKRKCHTVLGGFFFFFIVMWDLSWLCQKSVDAISVASALNQGGGKLKIKTYVIEFRI